MVTYNILAHAFGWFCCQKFSR